MFVTRVINLIIICLRTLVCHKPEYIFKLDLLFIKTSNRVHENISMRNIIYGRSEADTCSFGKLQLFFAKNGALDSQPQVIKFTSCLPMVGGSLRILWLLPPLKLVAMI